MSKVRIVVSLATAVGVALAAFVHAVPAGAQTLRPDEAVAYQINVAHSGSLNGDSLSPPLKKLWSATFAAGVSYPLIAGGRVFVTVANSGSYGTQLYALDAATGTVDWQQAIQGGFNWSNAAYDNGQVFVINWNGMLQDFNAADGSLQWSVQLPNQWSFSSPPTASAGVVYTAGSGSGGTLYAVKESTGQVLWTQSVSNGDDSSPALSASAVFVSYFGLPTYAFNRVTGTRIWVYNGYGGGGGGRTTVYSADRLYVRDTSGGDVFDTKTGTVLRKYNADPAPAFSGKLGFFLYQHVLQVQDAKSGRVLWSFAGDGTLDTAPIVVNGVVYVGGSSGELYVLDPVAHKMLYSTNVGSSIPSPDEQDVTQPLTGLGAGEGLLVVPAGNTLVAYN